jgi:hypothetical protein
MASPAAATSTHGPRQPVDIILIRMRSAKRLMRFQAEVLGGVGVIDFG